MMRIKRFQAGDRRRPARPVLAAALLCAAVAGGCSADVARFDFPGLAPGNGGSTSSIPRPSAPMRSGSSSLDDAQVERQAADNYAAPAPRDGGIRMAALPDPAPAAPPVATAPPSAPPASRKVAVAAPVAAPPVAARGETIEVQQGDTLYGLSKRHKVPVSELMSVNGLTGPALKPGQKLVLPASGARLKPGFRSQPSAGTDAAAGKPAAAPLRAMAPKAANWDGSYTVKQGDSLYAIARSHNVQVAELQQVNGITDPRRVRPGVTLKVPAEGGSHTAAASPPRSETPAAPQRVEPAAEPPRVIQSTTQPVIINGEKKVAARTDTTTDVPPAAEKAPASEPTAEPSKGEKQAASGAATASGGKLRWPVKGKVLTGFGPRPDGTHNDGVNVAVPQGTEVHAAEGGVVAYAGSELKGYGNLVLVRHDNGWVTAYAHNEEIAVKRGDRVKRGQVIAKAGKTGQVDQPQVHFELRQGSKPVDPTPFMEKM